jgi:hypothetical protein
MEARSLTLLEPAEFSGRLQSLCAGSGVALVLVPELPKTRVCGASRWLSGTKALIALSLRYKSDGQFWFSFYHEAGHLHHHGRRETFIDEVMTDAGGADERRLRQEGEADRFAADFLVPRRLWTQLAAAAPYISKDLVESIAAGCSTMVCWVATSSTGSSDGSIGRSLTRHQTRDRPCARHRSSRERPSAR